MRKILFLPFWTTVGSSFPGSVGSKLSTFIAKLIVVQTLLLGWVLSRKLVFYLLLVADPRVVRGYFFLFMILLLFEIFLNVLLLKLHYICINNIL